MTAAPATTRLRPHTVSWGYWTVTAIMVAEAAIGGAMDVLRMPPFYPMMIELGYPGYLATILGIAKILAAIVLVAPRFARLKEWAYAGIMINMVGAGASHVATHHSLDNLIAPAAFAGLAILSWAWRPPARRLASVSRRTSTIPG